MNAAPNPRPLLGRVLLDQGLVDELDLQRALAEQERTGRRLGEILVSWGLISWLSLAEALTTQRPSLRTRDVPDEPGPTEGDREDELVIVVGGATLSPAGPREPEWAGADLEELRAELARAYAEIDRLREERAASAERSAPPAAAAVERPFLLFAETAGSYTLIERSGTLPSVGSEHRFAGSDEVYVVTKLGRSPLPGDQRPCAYLQRR